MYISNIEGNIGLASTIEKALLTSLQYFQQNEDHGSESLHEISRLALYELYPADAVNLKGLTEDLKANPPCHPRAVGSQSERYLFTIVMLTPCFL